MEPNVFDGHSHAMTDRVARRRFAEEVAQKHDVDAGDVEHVLANLTLPPIERLRRSMRRAGLGRIAPK
jgi:hypothetical protein